MALAEELSARGAGVAFVTDRRGTELVGTQGAWPLHIVRSGQVAGRGFVGRARGLVDLARGTLEARALVRSARPAVVVGFGGHPSVPPLLAAIRAGVPTIAHEQNAVLGRANRLLARHVRTLALSFEETERVPAPCARTARVTGNPVRRAIAALAGQAYVAPRPGQPFALLVVGGSLGARVMSAVVPPALARLPAALRNTLRVHQQCRPDDVEEVEARYREAGIAADLAPFFADVPTRLANAHLVVARAGASTVAELAAAGRPALLVPYRFAADDHQSANARNLERAGGGWSLPEPAFTPESLAARLETLMLAPDRLAAAAAGARAAGRPRAAADLARLVLELVPANGGDCPLTEEAA
jgi:UDP-N-acetylglucosamine--N-acetylmuramyl-(pentapeptide) pyrophosphoryl-undecaprenol N-acetylglucosamine transferase